MCYFVSVWRVQPSHHPLFTTAAGERLTTGRDLKSLWRAIDWKGYIGEAGDGTSSPTDDQFKDHFEALLNPPDTASAPVLR